MSEMLTVPTSIANAGIGNFSINVFKTKSAIYVQYHRNVSWENDCY